MAGRIQSAILIALTTLAAPARAQAPSAPPGIVESELVPSRPADEQPPRGEESGASPRGRLVRYDFDDDLSIESGPDTFRAYRGMQGTVEITSEFRRSGERSLKLRDLPGDGQFPELQGYLPLRREGRLFMRLSFLVVNPDQELNIALAGPNWFRLKKDGISFWLKTEDGVLRHISDGVPKRLFELEALVWYTVDVAFDLSRGRYDLKIRREGRDEPVVDLSDQPGAPGAVATGIDKFSIVGSPFTDDSSVVFYVDDVAFGVDEALVLPPFVAPGRRTLFVDRFVELHAAEKTRPTCPAMASFADVGLPGSAEGDVDVGVARAAFKKWRQGCEALGTGAQDYALAESLFSQGIEAFDVPLYRLSRAIARAAQGKTEAAWEDAEAARILAPLDPRAAVVSGLVAYAKGETTHGTDLWRDAIQRLESEVSGSDPLLEDLVVRLFYSLLWQERFDEAAELARSRMIAGGSSRDWGLRRGDAFFLSHLYDLARATYAEVRLQGWDREVLERLSDLAFKQGDLVAERGFREAVYGSIRPR